MAIELTERILQYVEKHGKINSLDLVKIFNEDHQKIIGAIKSLQTLDNVIDVEQVNQRKWEPTAEGEHVIQHGSHEAVLFNAIPSEGILQTEIMKSVPYAKVGLSKALAAGWIKLDKSTGKPVVTRNVESIEDLTQKNLQNIDIIADNVKAEYKKRKLVQESIIKSVTVKKGSNFVTKLEKQKADLTADLLVNNAWKNQKFKAYNFDALGAALDVGHLHPLLKVRTEFRKIFLEMGFTEMPTNNFVESSFWNFDALFQPQQHPARDAHDTFFIADPKFTLDFPQEYLEKVKQVHSQGGYGSEGYRYDWKVEEAQKNLLRTHTTAVSARMLYNLMQEGDFKPVKYFSIDRVFRNETLDATHLAEFHQVEGVIADYNLTLGDLIGTLYEFFKKLGIEKLEFKPAYNPYTEPSMEIFCYHEGLGKWIEIGNSGIFRPEMLLPMGLPENVNVIAWGLSLERPTMIKYKLNNIRDLVGPKVDLQMVYNNPICRLEKVIGQSDASNGTQKVDTSQLPRETCHVMKNHNIVIFCDPKFPPLWLPNLIRLVEDDIKITVKMHVHSSVKKIPSTYDKFCSDLDNKGLLGDISITLIWKTIGIDPVLKSNDNREIFGQVNIARYLNRIIEQINPGLLKYEKKGPCYASKIDCALEKIHTALHNENDKKLINTFISENRRYVFDEVSIVDLFVATYQL